MQSSQTASQSLTGSDLLLEVAHYAVMLHSHSKAQQTTDDLSSSLEVEACVDVDHLLVVDVVPSWVATTYYNVKLWLTM